MKSTSIWLLLLVHAAACHGPQRPASPTRARGPELFGAGLFTTGAWDFFLALAPDGSRALFGRADAAFERYTLYETRRGAGGRWSAPVEPPFARGASTADPHFAPDGRSVVFISNRPASGDAPGRYDIFTAALGADGEWGAARRLPPPVNGAAVDKWSPAVAASGNLYFGAELPGTRGGSDLWVARLVDGVYREPENLGDVVNTGAHEVEPWIAPDESYLIFSALRRAEGAGGYDLFVSRRQGDAWTRAEPLRAVNTSANEWNQSVSPDGRWLYFTSNRPLGGPLGERLDVPRDDRNVAGIGDGQGDMYRIPMEDIMHPAPTASHRPCLDRDRRRLRGSQPRAHRLRERPGPRGARRHRPRDLRRAGPGRLGERRPDARRRRQGPGSSSYVSDRP